MQRTPVKDGMMYGSDPNIFTRMEETPKGFINLRKRLRTDCDHDCDIKKEVLELKNMLSSLIQSQNTAMCTINTQISDLKGQLTEVQRTNQEIQKSYDFLSKEYDGCNSKIQSLEKSSIEYERQIKKLEGQVEELNRQNCQNFLEIRNVPTYENETIDSLVATATAIAKISQVDICKADIKDIRRLGNKSHPKRAILVNVSTPILKNKLLKAVKSYNSANLNNKLSTAHIGLDGMPKPIYVSDYLTAKAKHLHFLAREMVKSKEFKFCWTVNGKVYLRKDERTTAILVSEEAQITALKKDAQI